MQGLTAVFWIEKYSFSTIKAAALISAPIDSTAGMLSGTDAPNTGSPAAPVRSAEPVPGDAEAAENRRREYFETINESLNTHFSLLVALIAAVAIMLQRREVFTQRQEMASLNRQHRQTAQLNWISSLRAQLCGELKLLAQRDYLAETISDDQYFGSNLQFESLKTLKLHFNSIIASIGRQTGVNATHPAGEYYKAQKKIVGMYLQGITLRFLVDALDKLCEELIGLMSGRELGTRKMQSEIDHLATEIANVAKVVNKCFYYSRLFSGDHTLIGKIFDRYINDSAGDKSLEMNEEHDEQKKTSDNVKILRETVDDLCNNLRKLEDPAQGKETPESKIVQHQRERGDAYEPA